MSLIPPPAHSALHSQHFHSLQTMFFRQDKPLWTKNPLSLSCKQLKNAKKYEYSKVGKTLGLQTTRFLSLVDNCLYYFKEMDSQDALGSCQLENLYCQWSQEDENRYVMHLSNGSDTTLYYFKSDRFIKDNGVALAKFTVQLGFFQNYDIVEQLGQGTFASVYKAAQKLTHTPFAAKIFTKDTSLPAILRQVSILRQMRGLPNLCQYCGLFQTDLEIIILTQFIPGSDLKTLIQVGERLKPSEIKSIIRGIANGLQYCHQQQIIHRDIKPQNIIVDLDTMQATIIDFGLSLDLKRPSCFSKCGTSAYMAPEVYYFKQTASKYNNKCDVFSLGIVSHLLMLGTNPLKTKEVENDVDRNTGQLKEIWRQQGKEFLQKTLNVCPENRWDINQVLNCQFLGQAECCFKKVESCSTEQDKHPYYDL